MEEKKKHRITLIDILVLIAILALILAIVIPAYSPSHPRPTKIMCMSSMRQLHPAFILYKQDNQGWPDGENWCGLLKTYFTNEDGDVYEHVYLCPNDPTGPWSYAMNENIPADANNLPGDLVLLFESTPGWNQVGGPDDVVTNRHGHPGADIAFANGDVKFVKPENIPTLRWIIKQ